MKILITGVTGFIGQNLLPALLSEFEDISILTLNRNLSKASIMFPYPQCIHMTFEDIEEIIHYNPEIVLHLATFTTPENSIDLIPSLIDTNITLGVRLLSILEKCNNLKLFINVGSFAEYRLGPQQIDDAYLYAATKSAFRVFVDYYSSLCKFEYITVIPYSVYGGKTTVKRLMDYMFEAFDSKEPIGMTPGEQILDFIYIDDVCSFFISVIKKYDLIPSGEVFHLGTGEGVTIKELANMIETLSGKTLNIEWGKRNYRARDVMHAVAPIARNIQFLAWNAQVSLEDGLTKLISEKYRNNIDL